MLLNYINIFTVHILLISNLIRYSTSEYKSHLIKQNNLFENEKTVRHELGSSSNIFYLRLLGNYPDPSTWGSLTTLEESMTDNVHFHLHRKISVDHKLSTFRCRNPCNININYKLL